MSYNKAMDEDRFAAPEGESRQRAWGCTPLGCLVVTGGAFVLLAAGAGLFFWFTHSTLEKRRPEALAIANEFHDCAARGDVACGDRLAHGPPRSSERMLGAARKVREVMGRRLSAESGDWSWKRQAGTGLIVEMGLEAQYERGLVSETFTLVDRGEGFALTYVNFNSGALADSLLAPASAQGPGGAPGR